MSKVMVAMSGGIDSTAAALLLHEQGCAVEGVTFLLFEGSDAPQRAAEICGAIGVAHHVIDLRAEFYRQVVSAFAKGYERGITPNPCVDCNREIKFGAFFDWAQKRGADAIATGHYARIGEQGGKLRIKRAADKKKDQSYVLYTLPGSKLPNIKLPLGDITKSEARGVLAKHGIRISARESQDICFIPDGDYGKFLSEMGVRGQEGDFVDAQGRVLGRHKGIIHYTVGQRKGIRLDTPQPMYVCGINAAKNTVCLAEQQALFNNCLIAGDIITTYQDDLDWPARVTAKIRYGSADAAATAYPMQHRGLRLVFDTPQRAITPGQSVVLYTGDCVVGGGIIERGGKSDYAG